MPNQPLSSDARAIDAPRDLGAVARDHLRAEFDEVLRRLHDASRCPRVEDVHQLRVATRRCHAMLDIYGELLPRREARHLGKELRRVRRAAGRARDLDVQRARLESSPDGPDRKVMLKAIKHKRRGAQAPIEAAAKRILDSRRFRRSYKTLLGDVARGRTTSAEAWARARIRPAVASVLAAQPDDMLAADDADLHEFRIRTKALRYALEALDDLLPPEAARLAKLARKLQDRLGHVNDQVVAQARYADWSRTNGTRRSARALRAAAEEARATYASARAEAAAWWSPERARRFRELAEICAGPLPIETEGHDTMSNGKSETRTKKERKRRRRQMRETRKAERRAARESVTHVADLERREAIATLERILDALRAGSISVGDGKHTLDLELPERVRTRVTARRTYKTDQLDIQLRWPRPMHEKGTLEITTRQAP